MTDTICKFDPDHLVYLNTYDGSKDSILTNFKSKEFLFLSIISKGILLGVLGCKFLSSNTCELYAVPDIITSKRYNKTFHRSTLTILKKLISKGSFNRFQFLVDVDFYEGQRWAKSLGFEYEATLRKYSETGEDQFMYVRFK
jgi:hypothetical protein